MPFVSSIQCSVSREVGGAFCAPHEIPEASVEDHDHRVSGEETCAAKDTGGTHDLAPGKIPKFAGDGLV